MHIKRCSNEKLLTTRKKVGIRKCVKTMEKVVNKHPTPNLQLGYFNGLGTLQRNPHLPSLSICIEYVLS